MSKRRFTLVTALLLIMLVAAIANNVIIYRAYNSSMTPSAAPDAAATPVAATSTLPDVPAEKPRIEIPNWHGEVALEKTPDGTYDVVVQALQRGTDAPLPISAVNADIRKAEAGSPELTLAFEKAAGFKFIAHTQLAPGTWEVRVHIHRDSQTLEFAERFDLKN